MDGGTRGTASNNASTGQTSWGWVLGCLWAVQIRCISPLSATLETANCSPPIAAGRRSNISIPFLDHFRLLTPANSLHRPQPSLLHPFYFSRTRPLALFQKLLVTNSPRSGCLFLPLDFKRRVSVHPTTTNSLLCQIQGAGQQRYIRRALPTDAYPVHLAERILVIQTGSRFFSHSSDCRLCQSHILNPSPQNRWSCG